MALLIRGFGSDAQTASGQPSFSHYASTFLPLVGETMQSASPGHEDAPPPPMLESVSTALQRVSGLQAISVGFLGESIERAYN